MTWDIALWVLGLALVPLLSWFVGGWYALKELKRLASETSGKLDKIDDKLDRLLPINTVITDNNARIVRLREMISEIGDEVNETKRMHDVKDADGVYRWYFPSRIGVLLERFEDVLRDFISTMRIAQATRDRDRNGNGD